MKVLAKAMKHESVKVEITVEDLVNLVVAKTGLIPPSTARWVCWDSERSGEPGGFDVLVETSWEIAEVLK